MSNDPFDAPGKRNSTLLPPHKTVPPSDQKTRPSGLRFQESNHWYFDGKKWLPSVTGIIKRIGEDQGGLMIHHSNITAKCAIEEAAEVSRLRRLEGDDAAFEYLRKAADRHKEKAGVKGSDLHDIVDRMQSGAEVPEYIHDDILAMAKNVIAFLNDYQVQTLYSEVRLAHRTMGYAGTCDVIGIVPQFGQVPVCVDWKTSKSMYEKPDYSHAKNGTQLAPYSRAEFMFWDNGTEADMVKVSQDVGLIVMVRPEDYKVYDYDLHRAWPQFKRAFASYWWWRDDAKTLARPARPNPPAKVEESAEPARLVIEGPEVPLCGQCGEEASRCEHARPVDPLTAQIREVLDPATFDDLWENNSAIWTDEHTEAVKARIAELGIAS